MLSTWNHNLTHFMKSRPFSIQTDDYSLYQTLHKACFVLRQKRSPRLLTPIIASIVCKYNIRNKLKCLSLSPLMFSPAPMVLLSRMAVEPRELASWLPITHFSRISFIRGEPPIFFSHQTLNGSLILAEWVWITR